MIKYCSNCKKVRELMNTIISNGIFYGTCSTCGLDISFKLKRKEKNGRRK